MTTAMSKAAEKKESKAMGPDTFPGEVFVFMVCLTRRKFTEKEATEWIQKQGYKWKATRHNVNEWQFVQRRAPVFVAGSFERMDIKAEDGKFLVTGIMRMRAVTRITGDSKKRAQDRIAQRKRTRLKPKQERDAMVTLLEAFGLGGTIGFAGDQLDMQGKQAGALIRAAIEEQFKQWSGANHRDNFVKYISFQIGVIKRLDNACKMFMEDPESKQYTALVSACKAQSEIYERLFDRGIAMGVIETKTPEDDKPSKDRSGMLSTLRKELRTLTDLVAELEVEETQTTRTRRVKVKTRVRAGLRDGLGTLIPGSGKPETVFDGDEITDEDLANEVETERAVVVSEP